ncbi:MAG TPA: DeoR/GlpR family DNA-binding transcription regulator [Intrasporangium sp.]|uniref:DeoR/GlpR family DNA-binding transcription regulator n=1 Tax=Intrasporangium sp. TaxID=1925024 RepID=UPI002D79B160|nr:DeoR/GlpR family DNA-binding transcription regulator [Intrasporangium sp.]HET7398348.1 DeoR/GlpR family DNA-binding transcription regulator [Intrasporangium sp.]
MEDDSTQLPASRKAAVVAMVAEAGQVTVQALAERLGVSADTIRRDLDQLDGEGLVMRTRGGAVDPTRMPRMDPGLNTRIQVQPAAKERIGAIAAGLVTDGDVLIINAGTTTLALARHLHDHRGLTIATNNLRLATEISPKCLRDLYVFGGDVRHAAQATIGPVAFPVSLGGRDMDIRCDLAFITVGGVSTDGGFSTSNLAEAGMMREMVTRASKVAMLADSTKFGRRLFAQIAPLEAADYFVTDREPPADLAAQLRRSGVEVLWTPRSEQH